MGFGAGCLKALFGACVKSDPGVDTRVTPPLRVWQLTSAVTRAGWLMGQAMAQVVPVWVKSIASRRRRFSAAVRWCSQWLFLATPR